LERNTRGAWIAFAVTTLALVYTHNITLFLLPAQALFVLIKARRQLAVLRAYALTMVVVGLLWLPWAPVLVHQARGVIARFWIAPATPAVVGSFLLDLVNAFPPRGADLAGRHLSFAALLRPLPLQPIVVAGHPLATGVLGPPLLLFALLALLGLIAGVRRYSLLYLLSFALPIALDLGLSHWRPIFEERVLLYAVAGLLMLVAAGIAAIRFLPLNVLLLAPVLWVNVLSLNNYNVTSKKEQWNDAATYVAQQARPGDLILFNATWAQLPFDYYYRTLHGPPLVEHGLPVDLFDRGVLEPPMQESDIRTAVKLTAGRQHVWVLLSHDWYNDPEHLIRPTMQTLFPSEQVHQFNGILVLRYSR
jgi:hypothetical protein